MIVPRARLLHWFAIVALPFSVLGAVYADAFQASLAVILVLLILALVDALWSVKRLAGIQIELPEVVRMSRNREGAFEVRIHNAGRKLRQLRLGLPWPRELATPDEDLRLALPEHEEESKAEWRCRPLQRGRYAIRQAFLETTSPIGFWARRESVPVQTEIRVYPNLLAERKNLAALFLHRGGFGIHAQRQVGKGREFEKLREYIPGDSFDDIHWKATAKRGHPVTKVFQIERTQEVYVVIDASRLSGRPMGTAAPAVSADAEWNGVEGGTATAAAPPGTVALERFITAALVLGLAAEQQGDLFGVCAFTDRIDAFLRAKNGKAHYSACRDALYTLQPQTVTPDFDELAAFIRLRLRRRALLIFLTALDDPVLAESFVRNMDLLCRQHLVLVNMLRPPGAEPLFSNADTSTMDDIYRRLGGHLQWHNLRELEKVLQRRGVRFSLLDHEQLSVQLVSQYLGVKQRQML